MGREIEQLIKKYQNRVKMIDDERNIMASQRFVAQCKRSVYNQIITDLQQLLTKTNETNEQDNRQ